MAEQKIQGNKHKQSTISENYRGAWNAVKINKNELGTQSNPKDVQEYRSEHGCNLAMQPKKSTHLGCK